MDDLDDYSELYGEPTDLAPARGMELEELAGPGAERSTGLVLTWRSRLVFAIDPNARAIGSQGQVDTVAFVGVGGHLEAGEGWEEAATREAIEEANCAIAIGDSPVSYLCRAGESPRPLRFNWREPHRPLLVWTATFNLRRGPERKVTPVTLINAVFRAAALGRPSPGAECTALLLLDQAALLETYAAPQPLGKLLALGAELVGAPLPAETLLAPGGSAYFLGQWLAWQEAH